MAGSGRSQDKTWWLGGGALLGVLVLIAGWFLAINPQLSEASSTRSQIADAQAQNVTLRMKNENLKEQNEDAGSLRTSLVAALAQLPSDGGLPEFTRQLSAQATAASVVLTSVVIGAATPVATAANASAGQTQDATATTSDASGSTAAAVPAASSTGIVQMTITVVATGLGRQDLAFLRAIQWSGPRRALVTSAQLSPGGTGVSKGIDGPSTLSLTLTIFSAPLSPTAQAALEKLLSGK